MTHPRILGLAFACLALPGALARAEEPTPTMTLVLSGQDALFVNIKAIMVDMAHAPHQYATLKDMVGDILRYTDSRSPLSYRVYLIGENFHGVYTAQISDSTELRKFRENLESIGFRTRVDPRASRGEELFRMSGSDAGSLRYDARAKAVQVVSIGNTKDPGLRKTSMELARAVTGPVPRSLLGCRDLILLIQNDTAHLSERRVAFSKLAESFNADSQPGKTDSPSAIRNGVALKEKLPPETAAEHDFHSAAGRLQKAEWERLFVESQRLTVGSKMSLKDGRHTLDIELIPLPDTSLARSVDLLGQSPDEFAAVASEGAVISGNINLPIDDLRQKHLRELNQLWSAVLQERIDARSELSPEARQSEKDLGNLVVQVLGGVAESGVFNGCARVYQSGKTYTTVGAMRVPEGGTILTTLERLARRTNSTVELEIETVSTAAATGIRSSVTLHSLAVPHATKDFPEYLDRDGRIYIGTGEKTVWFAYGEGALDILRKAIQDTASKGSKPSTTFIDARLVLHPYLSAWDRWQGIRGAVDLRRVALEGLSAGNDVLTVRLWRDEGNARLIHLESVAESGLLHAVGKIAARIIHENIEQ